MGAYHIIYDDDICYLTLEVKVKIAVVGLGYVGLMNAVLLAQKMLSMQ